LAGYALNGGGFNNYLGALRSRGLIKDDGDRLTITDAGIDALGSWEPLPTGSALVGYWRGRLGKAERLILETLTQAYPVGLTKEEVAIKAGYEANGGGFNDALGRLRTLGLVEGREIKASGNLFDAGEGTSAGLTHQFHAIAFEENLRLRQLTGVFAGARTRTVRRNSICPSNPTGGIYVYPFGAMVTCDVPPERTVFRNAGRKIARVANSAEALGSTCLPEDAQRRDLGARRFPGSRTRRL
jgi:hypothetical protein